MRAAAIVPEFHAILSAHLAHFAAFSLERPEWYPAGLPRAIGAACDAEPATTVNAVVGGIAYHCALDAMDDVQDGDAALWSGLAPPEILNAGIALQMVAQEAFRLAGCGPRFWERFHALALETAAGQALDLGWQPARLQELDEGGYFRIVALKTGSTFEIITRAACDAMGVDGATSDRLAAWARALGVYMQVVGDNDDAAEEPSGDLAKGKPCLAVLYACGALAPDACATLLESLSRYGDSEPARTTAHRLLRETGAHARAQARAHELGEALAADIGTVIPGAHQGAFRRMIFKLDDAGAGSEHPPAPGPSVPAPKPEALAASSRQALAAIASSPLFCEAWDVHRWGFCGHPTLVGDVFPVGLVAAALQDCGADVSEPRWHLLSRANPDGWRYFPEMPELPPDNDVLGQVLQVLAVPGGSGPAHPAVEAALSTLLSHIEAKGAIPTWLERGSDDRPQWDGNDCVAAVANAYYGLLRYDPIRFGAVVQAGLPYFFAQFAANGDWKSFWYVPAYARYAVVRLLAAATAELALPAQTARDADACLSRTRDLVARAARPDGTWDGPLATALALLTLAGADAAHAPAGPGLRLLLETQRVDGYWPSWALYLIPGRDGGYTWYGSRSVTTAFCLRAISLNLGFTWA